MTNINPNQPNPTLRLVPGPAHTQPAHKPNQPNTSQPTTTQRAARVTDSIDIQSLRLTNKPASEIDPKPITAHTPKTRQSNNAKLIASIVNPTSAAPTDPNPWVSPTPTESKAPSPSTNTTTTNTPTTNNKISLQAAAAIRFYTSPADQSAAFTAARAIDVRA